MRSRSVGAMTTGSALESTKRKSMKRTTVWAALVCVAFAGLGPVAASTRGTTPAATRVEQSGALGADVYDALPMRFEPNVGQTDDRVRFVARGQGYAVFLTDEAATLSLTVARPRRRYQPGPDGDDAGRDRTRPAREALRLSLDGVRPGTRVVGERPLAGRSNYLVGHDPAKWRAGVETFAAVRYEGVYEGVDAVFYGIQKRLEYDFEVAPGADPSQIRLRFEGQRAAEVTDGGDLVLRLGGGEVRQQRAFAYQRDGAALDEVDARYTVGSDGRVGLTLGAYDATRPLVVDPILVYGDFIGGSSSFERAGSIAVDAAGNTYLTGVTDATNFPTTPGAYDTTLNTPSPYYGGDDAFVAKVSADGSTLLYATYLGGDSDDRGYAVAVDAAGNAYVTGQTRSLYFPATPGAYDTAFTTSNTFGDDGDAFVAKLNASGSALVYATYLGSGRTDEGHAIAVAANGSAYVAGLTFGDDFPTTASAYDTSFNSQDLYTADAFVAKLDPAGAALSYGTYIGGTLTDEARAIALDAAGNAYVAGNTNSETSFPTTPGAPDATADFYEAFAAKLNATGSTLVYSTFVGGGGYDTGHGVAVDAAGAAYVVGYTSASDFPTTPGALVLNTENGAGNGFVTKLNATGTAFAYSASFGGGYVDEFKSVVVDASGRAYVAGQTQSSDFPTTPGALDTTANGDVDIAAFALNAAGSALVYSTYLGGVDEDYATGVGIDSMGRACFAGWTYSINFPTTPGSLDPSFNGYSDAFVARFDASGALVYSTMVSGTSSDVEYGTLDEAHAVTVDASGATYVVGRTWSPTFPTTPGAYDDTLGYEPDGDLTADVFVSKIAADGSGLVFSTLLGGVGDDDTYGLAVDATGAVYVAGSTSSSNFPTTPGAYDRTHGSGYPYGTDAFLTKLAPGGGALVYSTFLGANRDEGAYAVALGPGGTAYVTGQTRSPNFPTTPGAYDATIGGYDNDDAFVTRVSANGSALIYSTFVGSAAEDFGRAIAVDASGAAYVTGETRSPNFPTTPGAFDDVFGGYASDSSEGFVTKVSPGGDALAYSSFLGGENYDYGASIAVDASGAAYVTGNTLSSTFPITAGAFDTTVGTVGTYFQGDAFVTKVDPSGTSLVYSTYLGGDGSDAGYGIALGAGGVAYVVGYTQSTDFLTTPDALDTTLGGTPYPGTSDAFVTGVAADGTAATYSSYLGGSSDDVARGAAVGPDGDLFVVGYSRSTEFLPNGFGSSDSYNAFVARFRLTPGSGADTAGVYVASAGAFFLRNSNSGGAADVTVSYGPVGAGWTPLVGDWDGDGDDTPGLYDPSSGFFFLRNASTPGPADLVFSFGPGGAGVEPVTGDWNGDNVETVGIYVRASGAFFLRNANETGDADVVFTFGPGGADIAPLFGDYDGDGDDTVGIYSRSTGAFFLRNSNAGGAADVVFTFGPGGAGVVPLFGDYDGDGDETVGIYVSSSGAFFLKNANGGGAADVVFTYGPAGGTPLVGDWDGV
jgi:hypothetical protein